MKKTSNNVSKPQPFIAPGSEKKLTPEEINKRKVKFERLEKIGEKHTIITGYDGEGETENPYRIKAMILINQDKDVPEELIKQIEEYDKQLLKTE
ncbi:hypothetical protein [Butyrivibrio sp. AC2005]|uniref:hypothetical protein n=1 Tax=Butyrivibrio sp. AC2005 TaxID=1280672 RepID=UPI000424E6BE|nr:hypothetical protein [Butyrivibrio sp. AC2005]